MKILHFDIISGISGDMTLGALCHLGVSLDPLKEVLADMGLVDVNLTASHVKTNGIGAMRFEVHGYDKRQSSHRSWMSIQQMLKQARLSKGALRRSMEIFGRLAESEAKVHQTDSEKVVFHEVGAIDSIVDIVGCAIALEQLDLDMITSSTPLVGHGVTYSQHGPIPVPSPATLELFKGVRIRGCDVEQEMTTPTGAAILVSQVDRFTTWPHMSISAIGYGAGSREMRDRPNFLRIVLGQVIEDGSGSEILLEANIDDMNPEHYDHLMELLLQNGAHDVWLQPIIMKKSRPAITLAVLCNEKDCLKLEGMVFRQSTTIGIRKSSVLRRKLDRRHEVVHTSYGSVRLKLSGEGDEIWTVSPEYEDCRKLAEKADVPLKNIYTAAISQFWNNR